MRFLALFFVPVLMGAVLVGAVLGLRDRRKSPVNDDQDVADAAR